MPELDKCPNPVLLVFVSSLELVFLSITFDCMKLTILISSLFCVIYTMPQALGASSHVYQGVWVYWGKGKTLGAMLTVAPSNASILVAVVAIFVQVAGSQLWKVFQLALHQRRATTKPRDGLHHQQQAILRNDTSDFSSIWQLLNVGFAWRRQKTIHPLRRSIALAGWALLHFLLFAFAGIFSTLISASHS
jgi:hypothetical protein